MKRFLAIMGVLAVVLGGGLALDLANRGLVWRFFYDQTGEESPLGQLRGMVELLGNVTRIPLNTAPLVPIQHKSENPYGINVFLQKEVEEPKLRVMLETIRQAGFTWLRQEFVWEDLEVDGRGQFTDTRNDFNGDGIKDTINAWEKYDNIVALAEEYGFKLLVRLSNPPDWAIADPAKGTFAPPDDIQDYVNFASAVAERYKGRITHYQIWNEPNIYPEWGEQFADPIAYTDMLCKTYRALKAIDPAIVVISAAIAPTISLDGYMGYQDLMYLQTMYDHGAGACFDVLAGQAYGLYSGATDRRMRPTTVNVARHTYYRAIMVAQGDAHKPIWLSEASWNAVASATLQPEQIADYDRFGVSTQAQSARYTPELYQRAQEEWSWVGGVFYWFFTRPDPFEAGQSFYYFRMVEPDYSPEKPSFTPLPVYDAMKQYITTQTPTLYRGVHQAESWQFSHVRHITEQAEQAQFGTAIRTYSTTFTFYGTDIYVRVGNRPMRLSITLDNGDILRGVPFGEEWQYQRIFSSRLPELHTVTIRSVSEPFVLDSIIVDNKVWANVGLLAVLGGIFGVLAGVVLCYGLYKRLTR